MYAGAAISHPPTVIYMPLYIPTRMWAYRPLPGVLEMSPSKRRLLLTLGTALLLIFTGMAIAPFAKNPGGGLIEVLIYLGIGAVIWRVWGIADTDVRIAMKMLRASGAFIRGSRTFMFPERRDESLMRTLEMSFILLGYTAGMTASLAYLLSEGLRLSEVQSVTLMVVLIPVMFIAITWVVPSIWLLEQVRLRAYVPRDGTILGIGQFLKWRLTFLSALGGLVTVFIIFRLLDFSMVVSALVILLLLLKYYPTSLLATVLYREYREARSVTLLKERLTDGGIPTFTSVEDAVASWGRRGPHLKTSSGDP